jgi:hypothetical protein
LTPIGIFINLFYLIQGERVQGILIKDGLVFIKESPTIGDRVNWFINGVFIVAEGMAFSRIFNYDGLWPLFLLTAFVAFISCLFPRLNLNKISTTSGLIVIVIFILAIVLLPIIVSLLLDRA